MVPTMRALQRRRWITRIADACCRARRRSGGNDEHDTATTDSATVHIADHAARCAIVRRGRATQPRHSAADTAAGPTSGIIADAFRRGKDHAAPTTNGGNAPCDRDRWRGFSHGPGADRTADRDTIREYATTDRARHGDKPANQYADGYARRDARPGGDGDAHESRAAR